MTRGSSSWHTLEHYSLSTRQVRRDARKGVSEASIRCDLLKALELKGSLKHPGKGRAGGRAVPVDRFRSQAAQGEVETQPRATLLQCGAPLCSVASNLSQTCVQSLSVTRHVTPAAVNPGSAALGRGPRADHPRARLAETTGTLVAGSSLFPPPDDPAAETTGGRVDRRGPKAEARPNAARLRLSGPKQSW